MTHMERRKILIATKTYPAISTTYQETVCTAGILLDDNEQPLQWIRIYPIRFRYLDFDKRYPRWSIISAEIEKDKKDYRSESFRINESSLQIVRKIDTSKNWAERKVMIMPLQFESVNAIKAQNKSLGIIKPKSIVRYFCRQATREWKPKQQAILDQLDLFEPVRNLEKIPYQFRCIFTAQDGTKHNFSISDWEIMQLYRNCRDRSKESSAESKEKEAVEKVRMRLEDEFLIKKDLYFIVGNLKGHKDSFMIIGLFYPMMVKSD